MIDDLRSLLSAHPETLAREALGLAGLLVAILAALFVPALA
jgi:hypothetical protein